MTWIAWTKLFWYSHLVRVNNKLYAYKYIVRREYEVSN